VASTGKSCTHLSVYDGDYTIERVFRSRAVPRIEEEEEFGKGETSQEEKESKVVDD
jgi:hypothetical protein